ncbi:XRE family transcriptional regulator [Virgisporangium aliadipatigenens]|uniref:XRE family transcriptional regulator n=1 Tax=Virgisporangium aliadipatigenens TaxID=741659 RepID=A0A8J3YE33_9ACTN|nr:tetratricopeptide repeat protein [Virgisporangium aliadipatigenens]GIJ43399.1 XRE family transcriptional regulator [Virgisporangium aliadipatigenens]
MEFQLLGPVELIGSPHRVDLGAPRQRAVLAALLVDVGRVVTPELIVDRVWGGEPPDGVRRSLHAYVARLRRALREAGTGNVPLVHRSAGYTVDLPPERVDLHRFRDLAARGERESLRAALELWRGEPLAGITGHWADRMRRTWQRERLDTVAAWASAELSAGNPSAVLAPLTELVEEEPLAETLAATLMRALALAGRQAEALDRYTVTRQRLVEELGVDPGPALREAHRAILRGELGPEAAPAVSPSATAVPAQLPGEVAAFTGRDEELAALDAVLAEPGSTAVPVAVVSGTAGVGKTALAVCWAHRARDRFPDGQLYADLRGYDPERPADPADVLAGFLLALGVPPMEIPLRLDERAARYRTETSGRRILILLDNAATVEQTRPLLPGTGTCAVLVTSRDSLAGLVALHGARRVDLGLLPRDRSVALLRRLIGTRVDDEPAAAAVLADQCARLPLALRLAAELAAARHPATLSELVTELADQRERLDRLDAGGDPRGAVTAVFSWSLRHLRPAAVRLFALLGLHPGLDLDEYAAAALAGEDLRATRENLALLVRAHLVHAVGARRYGMHDLLRVYAASTVDGDGGPALTRLFDHYLGTAAAAVDVLHPAERHHRPPVDAPATAVPDLSTPDGALSWLDGELPNLTAMAAHRDGARHAIRLSGTLFRYLDRGRYLRALTIHAHAIEAARRAGDVAGEAVTSYHLGTTHLQVGRLEPAADKLARAVELFGRVDDAPGAARAAGTLGLVEALLGRYATAHTHQLQALEGIRRAGDRHAEARALTSLGLVEGWLGDFPSSFARHEAALERFREFDDRVGEATALANLAEAQLRAGLLSAASANQRAALELFRRIGHPAGEAWALNGLGVSLVREGRPAEAIPLLREALTLARQTGDRSGEVWALNGLGEALTAAGDAAAAVEQHRTARLVSRDTGERHQQARADAGLARACRALGDAESARRHLASALAGYAALGMAEADGIRAELAAP